MAGEPIFRKLRERLGQVEARYSKEVLGIEMATVPFSVIAKKRELLAQIREQAMDNLTSQVSTEVIAKNVTKGAIELTQWVIEECLKILGPPPCKDYAIIGLGSMSREEMSLFSDLEFGVLLGNKEKGALPQNLWGKMGQFLLFNPLHFSTLSR